MGPASTSTSASALASTSASALASTSASAASWSAGFVSPVSRSLSVASSPVSGVGSSSTGVQMPALHASPVKHSVSSLQLTAESEEQALRVSALSMASPSAIGAWRVRKACVMGEPSERRRGGKSRSSRWTMVAGEDS
ncbi:hypothetical protein FRC98_14400 [Lujinxingia vulgaris]|uniref:Secreted protein n=1 Tax=Lujinxingia vulgaris TaxID=2600176 RepID=A0A5C6XCM0_9DELT|nr:hypothetical protein FRC98_14400 [Lujinxingia vulgaris]